jgi:hypothetical protein
MDGLSSQFAVQLHFRYHNDGHIVIGGACSVSTAVFFNTSFLDFYGHILPFFLFIALVFWRTVLVTLDFPVIET